MTVGGKNLIILGVSSIAIAMATTGVSLAWYHNSGDIYLDRSRPGYLPDKEEIEQQEEIIEEDYEFSKDGPITEKALDEYLEKLQLEIDALNVYSAPFGKQALSDEKIGL